MSAQPQDALLHLVQDDAATTGDASPPDRTITTLLRDDHRATAALFVALLAAPPGSRAGLVRELVHQLKVHDRAEEEVFYVRLEQEGPVHSRMRESRADHRDLDLQLDRLAGLDGDDRRLLLLVQDLRADVDRHVRSEEQEIFAVADALLDDGEAAALGDAFLVCREQFFAERSAAELTVALAGGHVRGDGAPNRPAAVPARADMDHGFEDRGVGSDGSSTDAGIDDAIDGALDGALDDATDGDGGPTTH